MKNLRISRSFYTAKPRSKRLENRGSLSSVKKSEGVDAGALNSIRADIARISKMWQFDEEGRIYTPYMAYSLKDVAAFGPPEGGSGGGGMSEEALAAYLTREGYATQIWVRDYVAANAPSVDLSDFITKVDAAKLFQPKGDYLTEHQDISHLLSTVDAAKLFQPKGDYALASHIHSQYLTEHQDISHLLPSSVFDELFEKVNIDGTDFIKAKLPFFSVHDVAAFGPSSDISGGTGGTAYDRLDIWGDYSADKAGWVLSAGLGYDLHTRLCNVYGKTTIDSMLGNYVTLATPQTIDGRKTFSEDTIVKQIKNNGFPKAWVDGRVGALLRTTAVGASTQYVPLWSAKSVNGSWDCGTYSSDVLYFSYIKDSDFNAGNNVQTALIRFLSNGQIAANSFYKSGGTATEMLMADGSTKSLNDITFVSVADAKASVDTSQSWQAYRTDLKARFFDVYDNGGPDSYGCVLEIAGRAGHWQPQLWFGGWVNGVLRHRNRDYNSGTWGPWHTLLDTANYAATLDTRYMRRDTFDELFEKVTVDGSVFIKAKLPFFSINDVFAFGPGADIPGGSGGAAYERLDTWGDYSTAKAGWVLSAALGHDLHTRLQNVYGKPAIDSMLGNYVTLATRQEISGEKIFTNSVYVTNGRISGEISSAYTNHGIRLGISSRDYCDFLEYGAVWNFYKSRSGTETLVAKISEAGMSAKAFIKDGGTASQVLMADGSVASKVAMTAVSHLGWTSNSAAALLIPTMSALALWNGRYNATGSNLQYCDRGRFGDIVTHGHGEYVTALGISGDNITWTRNGATNSITLPYAEESSRMRVADIRDTAMTPAAFKPRMVTAWFNQTGTPSGTWYAGITVRGWTDGYSAWQLCSNATINTADNNLYFRIGINSSFQSWQKVLTDANYASMLDGRYVNTAGDSMTGDLAVRKMHLQGGNEFNCDDKLWIAYRSTPQGVNICHADQPFTYGSAGHDVLHRGNYASLVDTLNQPLTIRCGNDAKLIFDNTDGERYTRLSFREAGTEYAGITANSEAFIFSGKPVSAPYFKAEYTTLCPNLNADLLDGLHLSRTPAANAVPAYDADTMLPVSAGLNMRNDQMAELTAPGWYRVFSSHSRDSSRASLLLFLGRNYSYTNNENYVFSISLCCGAGSAGYRPTVTQLSGRAVGQLIPKIRVLQKWNSVYHVDIYYSGAVGNSVYSFGIGPGRFAAPVAAAIPDGYTSYEFGTVPNGFRCDGIAETTDLRLSRYLFFKHSGANNGIYLSPNPDGSLSISAHSGYSYAKSLGSIGYDGCFRITSRTAIGPSGFGVGLQLRDSNHTAVEVCGGNTTMGMGCHRDGRWYWWRGTANPDASSGKAYVMNFDGTVFNFGDRDIAVRRVYLDSACTVWFQYNAARGVIEASHTIVSRKDVAAFSA